ncbi:MAG: thiol:disulfide interchange protein DsbA/DsbL [Thiolinea sp.]
MKRVFSYLLPALAIMTLGLFVYSPGVSQAQSFNEGIHYGIVSPPVSTQAEEGKIEVMEIFWYGCPHCYNLEPTIHEYLKQKPENVTFNRVPAMLSPKWSFHGKLYYIGQMLDADGSKGVHDKIFEALHKQRRRIENDDQLRRFFKGLGYKKKDVDTAMKSMELKSQLEYAREITAKSGLDSVPTLIVNGKYLTSPSMVSGSKNMIDILNQLSKRAASEQ